LTETTIAGVDRETRSGEDRRSQRKDTPPGDQTMPWGELPRTVYTPESPLRHPAQLFGACSLHADKRGLADEPRAVVNFDASTGLLASAP
jgi:hypothetical protein